MPERIDVFISSTSRDLPLHRKEAIDACLRMGMFPIAMEHLPASDSDAIKASLEMVDQGELYLGIFAHRYGYIPQGHDISVTQMEYNRAVERGIPRLIFVMHEDHPVKASDIEQGEGAAKLKPFKDKLLTENIANFFKSPEDLRGQIIHSLVAHRKVETVNLHSRYANAIPFPPEPFVAHPYTLLQTKSLVGRKREIDVLTEWAKNPQSVVFNFVIAIGGMGKSALTWTWFNEIAPQVIKSLAGRVWWSFYESDGRFENFVTRTLAYVTRQSKEEIEQLSLAECESQLLRALDHEPFLIVLDGLERVMVAYARIDAARMTDDNLDEMTGNFITQETGIPKPIGQTFAGKHQLRKAADPRIGAFLTKLTQVKKSRILVSTRLYPAELQSMTGEPVPGSSAFFLNGLEDEDALNLWYASGVTGTRDSLLWMFHAFDNYPLLIRALAGEVASYRRSPGNFDKWRENNPAFSPATLPAVQVKNHVLTFALNGLDSKMRNVLNTISAFRMPAAYDTLADVLVGVNKTLSGEQELDTILTELEDRGLLGWDKRSNRYDLHPIVRSVSWDSFPDHDKEKVYKDLNAYFRAIPAPPGQKSLEDMTSSIELYNTLIGLKRYDEAYIFYNDRLRKILYYTLGEYNIDLQLLNAIPRDSAGIPQLSQTTFQSWTLLYASMNCERLAQPKNALEYTSIAIDLNRKTRNSYDLGCTLVGYAMQCCDLGYLARSEEAVLEAIDIFDQVGDANWRGISHRAYGRLLMYCGNYVEALSQFDIALAAYLPVERFAHGRGSSFNYMAQVYLMDGEPSKGLTYAKQALQLCKTDYVSESHYAEWLIIGASIDIALQQYGNASEKLLLENESKLTELLIKCRAINAIEMEIKALSSLAEYCALLRKLDQANTYCVEAAQIAEERHYALGQVDALNVISQVELKRGNKQAGIDAALGAYKLAWCDGSRFTYRWGLETAKNTLDGLGLPYPVVE